ncbi:MAG: hypothetical protein U9R50_03570 [Campylobacterota bacterium]|nr:hypothetical protein [Campylobacterota bacterium]
MRLFLLLLIGTNVLFAEVNVHEIAKKIDALNADKSLKVKVAYRVYDPFKRAKPLLAQKEKKRVIIQKRKPIKVETIFNNRAWVNGKWLQKGDTIHNAKVIAIRKDAIIILDDKKQVRVPLHQGKNLLMSKEVIQ